MTGLSIFHNGLVLSGKRKIMQLEDYFDFYPNGAIRLKGHRIDLEHVVREYNRGMNMAELLERFDTLNQAKIQACIDYYLAHKEKIDEDIRRWDEETDIAYQKQQKDPRIIALKKRFEQYRKNLVATPNYEED
jgi:uncharacterized protein (DUF433 family)